MTVTVNRMTAVTVISVIVAEVTASPKSKTVFTVTSVSLTDKRLTGATVLAAIVIS